MSSSYSIATIPGDGIGKEVIPAGREVMEALAAASGGALHFTFEDFGWGGDWYRAHGEMMPADGLEASAKRTPSSSAPRAIRTFPTTSRCGACA